MPLARQAAVESVLFAKAELSARYAVLVVEETDGSVSVSFSAPAPTQPVPSEVAYARALFPTSEDVVSCSWFDLLSGHVD